VDVSGFPTIKETIPFPRMRVLQTISPTDVLKAQTDFGPPYFGALAAWQANPNEASREVEVRRTLRQYAEKIVEWTAKQAHIGNVVVDVTIGGGATPTRRVLSTLVAL